MSPSAYLTYMPTVPKNYEGDYEEGKDDGFFIARRLARSNRLQLMRRYELERNWLEYKKALATKLPSHMNLRDYWNTVGKVEGMQLVVDGYDALTPDEEMRVLT